jgi:hypothetical protein
MEWTFSVTFHLPSTRAPNRTPGSIAAKACANLDMPACCSVGGAPRPMKMGTARSLSSLLDARGALPTANLRRACRLPSAPTALSHAPRPIRNCFHRSRAGFGNLAIGPCLFRSGGCDATRHSAAPEARAASGLKHCRSLRRIRAGGLAPCRVLVRAGLVRQERSGRVSARKAWCGPQAEPWDYLDPTLPAQS